MAAPTFSVKIATLADDTSELEVLLEEDELTVEETMRAVGLHILSAPKPPDAEAPLAFDLTIVRHVANEWGDGDD